jgi:DNA polymerase elongation subunit (family B)
MEAFVPVQSAAALEERDSHALLYGADITLGIVAVEVVGDKAVLLRREGGSLGREERPFRPWLLATEQAPVAAAEWEALDGPGYRLRARFRGWDAYQAGRETLRERGRPVIAPGSAVRQFLIGSGLTLFGGMAFDDLHRMQVDLETVDLDPAPAAHRILLAVVCDNRGGEWLLQDDDERSLISGLIDLIRQQDPDTLEGHNLFAFDLPFLAERARQAGVPLALGRDGSELRFGRERSCAIGANTRPIRPPVVWGRHCLDTLLGVQRFDVGRGELESFGLKECARHYGLASTERIVLDRARLAELWRAEPETVRRYALQDVQETRALAALVFASEFYQTKLVPDTFQGAAVGGSGEKINSLLIREYLRRGRSIPMSQAPRGYPGGYTEVRATGVVRRVVKADVESLYPSLMLAYRIQPASDELGVFLPLLAELTRRRLEAKARARAAREGERAAWDGMQSSLKVLINSFYGYLGGPFPFNDYDAAEKVTLTGQELVRALARRLEETGSRVIEIDTDGIYFTPPDGVDGEEAEAAYVQTIGTTLPDGIRLAHDGRYRAMVSLKIKNYVLVGYGGQKIYKGASLRSRADERFGREFIARALDVLVEARREELRELYAALAAQIREGRLPLEQFVRRERVTGKTFESEAKRRSRAVARGRTVGDLMLVYQKSDGTLGLAEEYAQDEDRFYLLEKLHKFASRLQEVIGPDFDALCPKPSRQAHRAQQAGQGALFEL